MHAFGPGQPLMAAKTATLRPAQAFPAKDEFQAVLQGRLVAHLQRGLSRPSVPCAPKAVGLAGGTTGARQVAADRLSGRQPQQIERRLPPERLPEVAAVLLLASFPAEPLQALLANPQVQQQGLSLGELRQAYLEAQATGSPDQNSGTQAGAEIGALLLADSFPPALAALLDLVAQSP